MTHPLDIPLCDSFDAFAWDPDEVRDLIQTTPLRFDEDGLPVGYEAEQSSAWRLAMTNNQPINSMPSNFNNPSKGSPTMSDSKFTVLMHPTLVDELDEGFSPMDGLVAIDEMFSELPLLHQALAPKRPRKRAGRRIKVYRGHYDWYSSLGFSYVQIGTTLHVLDLWYDENLTRQQVDVVLGQGQTPGYEPFTLDCEGNNPIPATGAAIAEATGRAA